LFGHLLKVCLFYKNIKLIFFNYLDMLKLKI
jgi:hypothetical protein